MPPPSPSVENNKRQQRGLALEKQLCLLPSPEPRTDALRVQRCSQFSAGVDGVELLDVDLRPLRLWLTIRHCRPFVSHRSALLTATETENNAPARFTFLEGKPQGIWTDGSSKADAVACAVRNVLCSLHLCMRGAHRGQKRRVWERRCCLGFAECPPRNFLGLAVNNGDT